VINNGAMTDEALPAQVPDRTSQRQFWNEWNDKYRGRGHEARLDLATAQRRETVLRWVAQLNLAQPRILDVGCATGWLTAQLAKFGEASGTDIADDSIRQAREWYPHIPFDCADFSTAAYRSEAFDLVVCLETLSHVPDQPAFISKIARVLKSGGHLILTTQNRYVFERRSDVAPRGAGQIRRWVDVSELRQLLREDFVVRRLRTLTPAGDIGFLHLVNSHRLNRALGQIVSPSRIERAKERMGFGQTIAVLAQRR